MNKISAIKIAIDNALENGAQPIAAVDADGTLWDMDMGEHFFEHQIHHCPLPGLPKDPWAHYREMHDRDTPAAFLWLAQINKGQQLSDVRKWSKESFDRIQNVPVFPGMREIVKHLQKSGVEIFVVTASIKWAVEPAAEFLGIPADHVIGVKTQVIDGVVTDQLDGVITWREGKVAGLLSTVETSHGARRPPFLAAGNTMGDLALLESATHLRVVNAATNPDHSNYETEQKLVALARARGWFLSL